jgi:hypothetical protein
MMLLTGLNNTIATVIQTTTISTDVTVIAI